jgi:hypothetical protein
LTTLNLGEISEGHRSSGRDITKGAALILPTTTKLVSDDVP